MKIDVKSRYPRWIAGAAPRPDFSDIVNAFGDRVASAEDSVAVAIGRTDGAPTETLTYRDLNARAEDLARALVASGARPGDRVGIATRRDFDVAVAMLGVLMAGAAYVTARPVLPAPAA